MRKTITLLLAIVSVVLACASTGLANTGKQGSVRNIVASDTILSGMAESLLPQGKYSVETILSPGQCPGHYDVKLSDIEKTKKADLIISFQGMPFMENAVMRRESRLVVDAGGRNWMAPDSYIRGLSILADRLANRFPADRNEIMKRKRQTTRKVMAGAKALSERLRRAGLCGRAVIASSMQKEPLAWMGFRIVAEYGRPEAVSAREVVRIVRTGRKRNSLLVVDNLQSGPDTGKGIAETLGIQHVTLTNFPSGKGYLATLGENVDSVLAAVQTGEK